MEQDYATTSTTSRVGMIVGTLALVGGFVGYLAWKSTQNPLLERNLDGPSGSPDFFATDLNNQAIDTSELRGQVVVVDVWATWCGPCVQKIPEMRAIHTDFDGKGAKVIGVSVDENEGALRRFVADNDVQYAMVHDPRGNIARDIYGVSGIPSIFVIDQEGKVVASGHTEIETYAVVESLLASNATTSTP